MMKPSTLAAVLCAGTAASLAVAHPDDPKVLDRQPPVYGPAYRADLDGGNPPAGYSALNMTLMSQLPLNEFGSHFAGNDCWGYVSPSGREYAIMGLEGGTGFVDITEPGNAQIVEVISGPSSVWRDIKVYQHYAYAVSEGGRGIQVMDLSNIDSGDVTLLREVTTGGTTSTHNVALNTASGYLYRCGGSNEGLRIYDLADPENPAYVAVWSDRYVHDAQVVTMNSGPYEGRELAFCCSGFNGGWDETGVDILDVTEKDNIVQVARFYYPNPGYSHQLWLSPDHKTIYLDDELDEPALPSTMHVVDISDPDNPVHTTSWTNGNTAITHNLYTLNSLVFASNYRSGLRIFDVSSPGHPAEVAYFDTYPSNDSADFNGNWSNYPLFPSGTVIASDMERGLFVLRVDNLPLGFSFPDGIPDLLPSDGASVRVRIFEQYGGQLEAGSPTLHYDTGSGYETVALTSLGDGLYDAVFPALDCGAEVSYYVSAQSTDGVTMTSPGDAPTSAFEGLVGDAIEVETLDDVEVDTGWTVGAAGDDATTGIWERVDPRGTAAQPEDDHTEDPARFCWVTGQGQAGGDVGDDDVDNGRTTLTTSVFDLSDRDDPKLGYWRWYSNSAGASPNSDIFEVFVSDDGGAAWHPVETVGPDGPETGGGWIFHEFRVSDFVQNLASIQLRFVASDEGSGSIVEAAVDDIEIRTLVCDASCTGDLDGSGTVDLADLSVLLSNFGLDGMDPEDGDLNGDMTVDLEDLSILLGVFGSTCQ